MHALARGEVGDAGRYKKKDSDIIEKLADGRMRVRFRTVTAKQTPKAMKELVSLWQQGIEERRVPPLLMLAAWNFDFLCIHPFRDGNGRVSRTDAAASALPSRLRSWALQSASNA